MLPLISIVIPTYKNVVYLERLLKSIQAQKFRDYEVIVTDDSTDDSIKKLVHNFTNNIHQLYYYKNTPALGMPQNWNEGVAKAKGEWIKVMHDDDWFSADDALAQFVKAAITTNSNVIFSNYNNVFLASHLATKPVQVPYWRLQLLKKNRFTILSKNSIGPPSTVMFRKTLHLTYDVNLKWLVDVDSYIQMLQNGIFLHLPQHLINVGLGEQQVTQTVKYMFSLQMKEHFYVLNKYGTNILNNIFVYDYWWRFIRNYEVKNVAQILDVDATLIVPEAIKKIIKKQANIPNMLLKNGLFSKLLMFASFLKYRLY